MNPFKSLSSYEGQTFQTRYQHSCLIHDALSYAK